MKLSSDRPGSVDSEETQESLTAASIASLSAEMTLARRLSVELVPDYCEIPGCGAAGTRTTTAAWLQWF